MTGSGSGYGDGFGSGYGYGEGYGFGYGFGYGSSERTLIETTTNQEIQMNDSRWVLIGNKSYGLYIGKTNATDAEIIASGTVRLEGCRHVAQWYGKTGGITSLAAHGPCGSREGESRVGAPCNALLSGVVNVFDLSPEAIEAFASVKPE
jgi:hypothetical protein